MDFSCLILKYHRTGKFIAQLSDHMTEPNETTNKEHHTQNFEICSLQVDFNVDPSFGRRQHEAVDFVDVVSDCSVNRIRVRFERFPGH